LSGIDKVQLLIGDRLFRPWERVSISRSLDAASASFDFTGKLDEAVSDRPKPSQAATVLIGTDRVITGYIDAVTIRSADKSISVQGRSMTADLVDCAAIYARGKGRWRRATPARIAQDLAATYGVEVVSEVAADALPSHATTTGERALDCIQRAAAARALLVTDDESGRLILTRAGSVSSGEVLKTGSTIIEGSGTFSAAEVFSEYRCKGQIAGSDEISGEAAAHPEATAADDGIGRTRILEIVPEVGATRKTCLDRARWEAASRVARSVDLSYTVLGWRKPRSGSLWRVNETVAIRDTIIGVDAELLIAEVSFELGEAGAVTRLKVAPPEAYAVREQKQARKGIELWQVVQSG